MLAGNVKVFDFLSKTRGFLNIGEPEPAKVTEGPDETIDRKTEENRQLNTMVLNSLLNHIFHTLLWKIWKLYTLMFYVQ